MQHHERAAPAFELCFQPLSGAGRALRFPCDTAGTVDLDSLSERARCNYFYARAVTGCEFAWPAVRPTAHAKTQ